MLHPQINCRLELNAECMDQGEVDQSKEWSSTLPYSSVYELLKREPSTKVANLTFTYILEYFSTIFVLNIFSYIVIISFT